MANTAELRNSAPIEIEPLTKRLGARLHGVDCSDVDDETWSAILAAFHTHHVLVFPDQDLTPDQHANFMERFGLLDVHPQELSARTTLPLPENPKVELMLNKPGNYGPRAAAWHTDVTFRDEPVAVTSLYGVETPTACADTIWTSMQAVFDDLTDGLKTTLRGLNAVHATAFVMGDKGKAGQDSYDPTEEIDPKKQNLKAQYREEVIHPVVHRHEAGYETLYVNPAFVHRIEGWSKEESDALLSLIYKRATLANYTYRHRWTSHDLVAWDNRCTMHFGVNDYSEADRRTLHRTTGAPFKVHASR
jgi:taurine dioxygenase